MSGLTHIDDSGRPKMVDVTGKEITRRMARAQARLSLPPEVRAALKGGELVTAKGPVFATAIIAGTLAVKKTAELIPFCHSLPVEHCAIRIEPREAELLITCEVATSWRTGVEMEALTGATLAALTVYDMAKALSHDMVIERVELVAKSGGKRDFDRTEAA